MKDKYIEVEFTDIFPDYLDNNKIYISEKFNYSIHNCFCGCGEEYLIDMDDVSWTCLKHDDGKITFTPSILNKKCKSHYIVVKNKVKFI